MKESRFLYRCRMCDAIYQSGRCCNPESADRWLLYAILSVKDASTPRLLDTHCCADGRVGVAELAGYEHVELESDAPEVETVDFERVANGQE